MPNRLTFRPFPFLTMQAEHAHKQKVKSKAQVAEDQLLLQVPDEVAALLRQSDAQDVGITFAEGAGKPPFVRGLLRTLEPHNLALACCR